MSEEMKNLNEQPEQAPVEKNEVKKPLDKKTIGIIAAAAAVVVLVLVLVLTLGGKKEYTLGMGVITGFEDGKAQVNSTVATVVLDKNGKIVACRLDAVQCQATLNEDGTYTVGNLKTKMELGDDYNMSKFGASMDWNKDGVVKEWYEQAKAFEAHVVGMTVTEVEAMGTQKLESGYVISNDEALLSAGCTIQIDEFKAAVAKACKDAQSVTFKAKKFTLGVAVDSYDSESSVATADKEGALQLYSDFAASVVVDGKIVASINDAVQPKITFNNKGEITGTSFKATKRELKEDYNMSKFGASMDWNKDGVVKEWYLQSAAFSAHVVGMTADEVKAMGTQNLESGYVISNDDALLSAGCTIQITGLKAVVAESVANAR